jgi:hypothetical protein
LKSLLFTLSSSRERERDGERWAERVGKSPFAYPILSHDSTLQKEELEARIKKKKGRRERMRRRDLATASVGCFGIGSYVDSSGGRS